VPVAVNLYKIRAAKGSAGDFFRAVQKQKSQYQGFWIVSPEGKVLAAHHDHTKDWTRDVLAAIDQGLRAFGEIEPRRPAPTNPLPFRGRGVQTDGSVTLALYVRYVFNRKVEGHGVIDSITLSAKEWKAFAPREATVGARWNVPPQIAGRLCKLLSPASDQSTMPRPEEVTQVEIVGTVQVVDKGIATLSFSGHLAALHKHPFEKGKTSKSSARLQGTASYDVKKQELTALVLVLDGAYHAFQPYDRDPYAIVAGAEWKRE
jgi:hypothetical protein